MPTPTIAAGYPRGLANFAVERGADRAALLTGAGLNEQALSHQDNRVPLPGYLKLFEIAAELTGISAISLEYGKAVRMQEISIAGLIGEACESVLDVPAQINRYANLVVDEDIGGEPAVLMRGAARDSGTWIEGPSELFTSYPIIAETEMSRLVWNTRAAFANDTAFQAMPYPISVHLKRDPPAYAADYERIFGAPVTFGSDWNAIQIDPRFGLLRQPPVNRYVFSVLSERAEALLASFDASKTVAGRAKGVLMKLLHTGDISMDAVAARLGKNRQKLYRDLRNEGTTFERILDDLRRELAIDFLTTKKVSVNQTAYLLGFSDPAPFSRAFKRWTGKSPSEVRLKDS